MITIKNGILDKIKNWTDDSIHVLTDFDRTITVGNSESSWSILAKSNLVPKEYVLERQKLFDYYRPFEIDENLDPAYKNTLMIEWWNKHIDLFIEYKLSGSVINEAANNLRVMEFRKGAKEFLKKMYDRKVPIIIISAGIGNFIEQFLIKNGCNFDNIFIVSNFIKFKDGLAVGVSDNVIHSLNKNEVALPDYLKKLVSDRPNIILLGDSISDIKMAKEEMRNNALKIGFLEEKVSDNIEIFLEQFDVVCTENTNYVELSEQIPLI